MTTNEAIAVILTDNGIKPSHIVGWQTAFQVVEAAVLGALETIEDCPQCINCGDKGCEYCGPSHKHQEMVDFMASGE